MALQVGELFASFTVDTSGIERALALVDARTAQVLDSQRGQALAAAWMEGMTQGIDAMGPGLAAALGRAAEAGAAAAGAALSPAAGAEIGSRFGLGIASGVEQAAARIARTAAAALGSALPQAAAIGEMQAGAGLRAAQGADAGETAYSVARAVSSALSGLSVQMDGVTVGNLVSETVSRNIAAEAGMRS